MEEILKVLKEAEWELSYSMPTEFGDDSPILIDGKTTLNSSNGTFHMKIQWD